MIINISISASTIQRTVRRPKRHISYDRLKDFVVFPIRVVPYLEIHSQNFIFSSPGVCCIA